MLKNPTDLKSIDSSSAKRHLCPFFFFFFGKSWRLAFHKEITYIKIYVKCVCVWYFNDQKMHKMS